MKMWVLLVWAASAYAAVTHLDLDSPDTLLDNLAEHELESLLEEKLGDLETRIMHSFEEQLKEHEDAMRYLQRRRRSLPLPPPPVAPENYWHGYVFDTIPSREHTVIDSVKVETVDQLDEIANIYPLGLNSTQAIYQDKNGNGYVYQNGAMKSLRVRNKWTESPRGCTCDGTPGDTGCACCIQGGKLCTIADGFSGDTCIEEEALVATCHDASIKPLQLSGAVAFEYNVAGVSYPQGHREVIVTSLEDTVYFYRMDEFGLQDLHSEKGHNDLSLGEEVKDLGYGELYVEEMGELVKKRYLFMFGPVDDGKRFFEVFVNTTSDVMQTGLLQIWQPTGSEMKTWQSSGTVMAGVLNNTDLRIFELATDRWGRQRMVFMQNLQLPVTTISWMSFSSGFDNFLLAVTPTFARLYVRRGPLFEKLQDILPGDLGTFKDLVPLRIPSCKDDVALLTGAESELVIYLWNSTLGLYELANKTTIAANITKWDLAYADARIVSTVIPTVIAQAADGLVAIEIYASLTDIPDAIFGQGQDLADIKEQIKTEYARQREILAEVDSRLSNNFDPNTVTNLSGEITTGFPIIIDGALTTKSLTAANMYLPGTDFENGTSYTAYKQRLVDLLNATTWIQNLTQTLGSVNNTLQDAVLESTNINITGMKIITEGLETLALVAKEYNTQEVYDEQSSPFSLNDYLNGIVRINDQRKVTGRKRFVTELNVTTLETTNLDDVPVTDIATILGGYSISGTVSFPSLTAETVSLKTDGTVGGVDISHALPLTGPIRLGSVTFDRNLSITDNLNVGTLKVDGIEIGNWYANALTKDGGEVMGVLQFTNNVNATTLEADVLSGINSDTFLSTVVFKDENATLQGTLDIPSFSADRIRVTGLVNAKSFPDDFPLKTNPSLDLGTKTFTRVTFENLTLADGANIDGIPMDSLVTLHGNQTIIGDITIANDIYVEGNLNVTSSNLKGIDLDDLSKNLTDVLQPDTFNITFVGSVSLPTISYNGTLNELDISILGNDIVYKDSPAEITGTKTFRNDLFINEAVLDGSINGMDFDQVVYKSDPRPINGQKTFQNAVTFNELTVNGEVDKVNVSLLFDSALYLDKTGQVVTGRKTFNSPVSAAALDVTGKVSDVDFTKILSRTGDQAFIVPQVFGAATFGELEAMQILMSDNFKVNSLDLSELNKVRMSKTNGTAHTGVLTVSGNLSASTLNAEKINGYNLQQLKDGIVKDDENAVLSSGLNITSLIVTNSVTTPGQSGANGLNISNINENAVHLSANNTLTGHTLWSNMNLQGNVTVGGLVGQQNISELESTAVFKNILSGQHITGTKTFDAGFYVQGHINTDTINDVDYSQKLVTLNTDQEITGGYNFSSFIARKNLTVTGMFNSVDIALLDDRALKLNDEVGYARFSEDVEAIHLQLGGFLETVNVVERLGDAVRLDGEVDIPSIKTFKANVTFKNLQVDQLNNRDFTDFKNNTVQTSVSEALPPITVNGLVKAPAVVAGSLLIQGTVDGVNYTNTLQDSVLLNGSQSTTTILDFSSGVSVNGPLSAVTLNGHNLASVYLTVNTVQTLTPAVRVGNLTCQANITVDGLVNGENLQIEAANTLKIHGGQTVTGLKNISGVVNANSVEVTGNINNGDFKASVVNLSTGAEITTSLNFTGLVTTKNFNSSTNIISGVQLAEINANAWLYNESSTIPANITFGSPVTMKQNFTLNGTLDGMEVGTVHGQVKQLLESYSTYNEGIKNEYSQKCPLIQEAYKDTEKAIFEADYFDFVNTVNFPNEPHSYVSYKYDGDTYVVVSWVEKCTSTVFKFDNSKKNLVHAIDLGATGYGRDWLAFESGGENYLVMAASVEGNLCSTQNSVVWKINSTTAVLHQDLLPGTKLSKANERLYIRAPNKTYEYHFNSSSLFELKKTADYEIDSAFWISGYYLTGGNVMGEEVVKINSFTNSLKAKETRGKLFIEQHGNIFLVLSVTRYLVSGPHHALELYEVKSPGEKIHFLDSKNLQEPATLTTFFAGNHATGATMVIVLEENYYPLVYTIYGRELKLFVELNLPKIDWVQHLETPNPRFPEIDEHYVLFGQAKSADLLHLKMNGMTHNAEEKDCNVDAFSYPTLMDRVV